MGNYVPHSRSLAKSLSLLQDVVESIEGMRLTGSDLVLMGSFLEKIEGAITCIERHLESR